MVGIDSNWGHPMVFIKDPESIPLAFLIKSPYKRLISLHKKLQIFLLFFVPSHLTFDYGAASFAVSFLKILGHVWMWKVFNFILFVTKYCRFVVLGVLWKSWSWLKICLGRERFHMSFWCEIGRVNKNGGEENFC